MTSSKAQATQENFLFDFYLIFPFYLHSAFNYRFNYCLKKSRLIAICLVYLRAADGNQA